MNRHHDYLSALISIGIGTAAFLILTTLATYGPLDGEYVDAALFAAFILSANLAAAYAARRMPRDATQARAAARPPARPRPMAAWPSWWRSG